MNSGQKPKPNALLWTDGSCGPGGCGGWASLVVTFPGEDVRKETLTGHAAGTTNNRMEMQAAIEGLTHLRKPHVVYLVSDSSYLLNTLKERWYEKWGKNAEFTRPNWDLWQKLIALVNYHTMHYVKVKGHLKNGDPYNHYVDVEAGKARLQGQEEESQ